MATKNISTYPVVDTITDTDKVVLSKDGTVRLVEMGTVKEDMRQEIRDAKGELQNELNSKTSATEAALDAERTARTNADANLQTQISNRYTKAETDELIEAEETARENANTNLQTKIDNLVKILNGIGPGFHSSIYRGKYLGDTYTDAQKQAIASGTFDDLFVGDYWTINGVNWRIADFDYYYNIGDTNFTKHHVVIVPDTILYSAQMNSESITTGAYTGSEMYTTNLDNARTAFDNAFGSTFIPTHRGLYANAVSGGNPSGWAWRDMRVELMSEEQFYGHSVWGVASHNGYDVGTQKTQFKLFTLDQTKINIRQTYWLTNVMSSGDFAYVDSNGWASYDKASSSRGVRPFACLVGE